MTKAEEYNAKAAESLAALDSATNERDRAHHRRAHGIWRKLIANIGEAEGRAAMRAPAAVRPLKTAPAKAVR